MKKRERISIQECFARLEAKHIPVLTGASVAVLFLLTVCVLTVTTAFDVRVEMEKALQQEFNEIQLDLAAVNNMEDVPKENIYSEYQRAMANQSDLDGIEHPFLSGSFLMDASGNVLVESRNCLICKLGDEDDNGNNRLVTLAFTPENTSDVAAILWHSYFGVSRHDPMAWASIVGYWDGSIFQVYEINGTSMNYISPVDPPADAELETIEIGANAQVYEWCVCDEISKNFGSENHQSADFISKWAKVDKLMKAHQTDVVYNNSGWYYGSVNNRGSLFSMKSVGFAHVTDQHDIFSGRRLELVYCTQYSPIGIAVRSLFQNGTYLMLLFLFTLLGCGLVSLNSNLRKREVQSLQDELVRQKRALEHAKEAEISRREMTSAIAHELKTPVAILSSYAEALQENIDAEKQKYYLEVIREETDRMDGMVLELLDLSRLEAGRYKLRRENFDLVELVRDIVKPLEPQIAEKNITLEYQIGEKELNADRYRFGQVVENFMSNAIRHTPEGGRIILRIGMNHETFSVENSGRSIPQEQLPKVWETFWQGDQSRNKRGSGLGLSICRSIVLLHGGSCRVENTAGGVRFTVNIHKNTAQTAIGLLPREKLVALEYPIAQEFTTVERMFLRLRLLDATSLRQELRAGNITCGGKQLTSFSDKLYPGNVAAWEDFRITVTIDNELKHKAILLNQFGASGRLSNFAPHVGATSGTGGA